MSLLLFDIIITSFPLPFPAFTPTYAPIFSQIYGFLHSLSFVTYIYNICTLFIHIYFQIQRDTLLCLNNATSVYVLRVDHLVLANQLCSSWGRIFLLFTSLFCCLMLFVWLGTPEVSPFYISLSTNIIYVQLKFRQSWWWYLVDIASNIPRRHNQTLNSLILWH